MHAYAEPFKWQMFEIWKSWGFGFKKNINQIKINKAHYQRDSESAFDFNLPC